MKIRATAMALVGMAFLVSTFPFTGLEGQEPQTLSLQEVFRLARERSPRIRAATEMVEVARAREPGAGLLPDPTLRVGVMNLALPELSATMPASMAPTVQAMQRFPIPGKLSLREEMARQATEMDRAASQEVWWEVRTGAATAFYQIYQVDRQIEVMEETLGFLEDFETVARAMYAAGTGRQADVLRANVDVARIEADIERMRAMRIGAASRLNSILDRPSETPVPGPALPPLASTVPDRATLGEWALESRPALSKVRAELARASTRRALAEKEIWPDFTVGLQYGLGRMAGDYRSMGGASVGFSIPLYAGRRQHKVRDEAAAAERAVRAELDQALALLDARIVETLANLDQARTLIRLYREEILPQARATVESSFSSYRVGAVDFTTLVDAQMAVNRFEGEFFALLAAYGNGLAHLEMTIGRDLPVTGELLGE
jgi:outer membrane protein TolC